MKTSVLLMTAYDPRIWAVLSLIFIVVARCDDFSTYPKG